MKLQKILIFSSFIFSFNLLDSITLNIEGVLDGFTAEYSGLLGLAGKDMTGQYEIPIVLKNDPKGHIIEIKINQTKINLKPYTDEELNKLEINVKDGKIKETKELEKGLKASESF